MQWRMGATVLALYTWHYQFWGEIGMLNSDNNGG